jgi:hypothetical protein
MQYQSYNFGKKSLKAILPSGYSHYCPVEDFNEIAEVIVSMFNRLDVISLEQIFIALNGVKLKSERPFSKEGNKYKVDMALFVLISNGFLTKVGRGKYQLNVNYDNAWTWLKNKRFN